MIPLLSTALIVLSTVHPPLALSYQDSPAATPGEESVEDLDREAREAYAARDYSRAAEAFSRAYDKTKDPNYLFNAGRVYEESGDLELSVEYYQRFLDSGEVDFEARKAALERVEVLQGVLRLREEKNAPEDPEPTPPPESLDPPETKAPAESPRQKEQRRKLLISGAVLTGVGAAALITGGVLGGLALRQSSTLESEEIALEDRRRRIDATETFSLTADILYGAGGAIAVTGVALIIASVKRRPANTTNARLRVAPAVGPTSASLQLSSRF